ncbi:Peptide chain release factor 1 [Chlorella vulgaris]
MAARRSSLAAALCRVAAAVAAGPPQQLSSASYAAAPSQLLHPVLTTLPSLLGWQPHGAPNPGVGCSRRRGSAGRAASGFCMRTAASVSSLELSDRVTITPAIEAQLLRIQQHHADLLQQLSGDAMSNMAHTEMARLNKELSDLEPVVAAVQQLQAARQEAADLQAIAEEAGSEEEMRQMAREERQALLEQLSGLERELLMQLLPKDSNDGRGVLVEVRAGTGGDEACLFALELFRMYERYAAVQGWSFEVVELAENELGGCKLASATIGGHGAVYGQLKFESGIHRVQRVPVTESSGRVHTSAASVAVLPQADEVDVAIRDEDVRIDTYRAGGAGGQHVNCTNSAVRVTHLPTGLVVAIQDERSQHKNKAKAMKVLRARMFEAEQQRQRLSQSRERKEQMGSGDRSERIRTYNFPQGRVTDHRVGVTEHGMDGVLSGERLGVFIEALQVHHQSQLLASLDQGAG